MSNRWKGSNWRLAPLALAFISPLMLLTYQNCSNQVSFSQGTETAKSPAAADGSTDSGSTVAPGEPVANSVVPQYAEAKAGEQDSFPPLKLVFVVDNSGTMSANQVNLGHAFEKMFDGENASNLTPFDVSALIISTAQNSVDQGDPILAKLPTLAASAFSEADFTAHRKNGVDGVVPGDLVGYRVQNSTTNGLYSILYGAAPVLGIEVKPDGQRIASAFVHKSQGGAVSEFASAFRDRLSVLDPNRSATMKDAANPNNTVGVMDSIIDRESGLCALARVLKSDAFIKPGDLSAYIVVSDENDNDPSGSKCVQEYKQVNAKDDLIDGRCDRSRTDLTYRAAVANPSPPRCDVTYNRGFNYSVKGSVPQTKISYSQIKRDYDVLRTQITGYTVAHTWNTKRTSVSYVTSSPSYEVPRTRVSYFREVASCRVRDGVKTECTYSYPSSSADLDGAFGSDCRAFVQKSKDSGKIPADILIGKSGYEATCAALANSPRAGACSASDATILNCKQNYSARLNLDLDGEPGSSTCTAFVQGKLPLGAIYTDSGYEPQCGVVATTANGPAAGACPAAGLIDCVNVYTPIAAQIFDGDYYSANTIAKCESLAQSKLPTAVRGDTLHPVACTAATTRHVTGEFAACSSLASGNINCVESADSTRKSKTVALVSPFAQPTDCNAFASSKLSGIAYVTSGPNAPSCAPDADLSVGPKTGEELFSMSSWNNYFPAAGDACSSSLSAFLATKFGLQAVTACSVSALTTAVQAFSNTSCQLTPPEGYCTSSANARRNCMGTDIPAGDKYVTAPTTVTFDGVFTCDMLCSATSFCASLPGRVSDNYFGCSTAPGAARTISSFTGTLANNTNLCLSGDQKIVTKGPYRGVDKVTVPVAEFTASSPAPAASDDTLVSYIRSRSVALFKANLPSVSVFVRSVTDPLGQNGSVGSAYHRLADLFGGSKQSVLNDPDGYASSLKSLSGVIRERLSRSFSIKGVSGKMEIRRVWWRKAGSSADWGQPIDAKLWSASGGTVTLAPDMLFSFGDQFRVEYY